MPTATDESVIRHDAPGEFTRDELLAALPCKPATMWVQTTGTQHDADGRTWDDAGGYRRPAYVALDDLGVSHWHRTPADQAVEAARRGLKLLEREAQECSMGGHREASLNVRVGGRNVCLAQVDRSGRLCLYTDNAATKGNPRAEAIRRFLLEQCETLQASTGRPHTYWWCYDDCYLFCAKPGGGEQIVRRFEPDAFRVTGDGLVFYGAS